MKNINISSPATGDLDSLVALPVPRRTGSFGSSGLKASPPVARSTAAEAAVKVTSEPPARDAERPASRGSVEQGTSKEEGQSSAKQVANSEKG